ncbi:hypothetical protein DM02DRAFT_544538 [Periconia macrospinosa]|uniref:Kinesin light chain n=1 Tax=Periconia macrospinosa TaxID=97972 RepID=A0A2V1D3H6_9PLEO|nr:hypothetical protein DM02DRAFT_544538 [Periconia macrospinosa]
MPNIHVGTIASSDVVLRAKSELDTSFRNHKVLGIDMEGGGVSEATDCIVIKGAVDYADTHKNKDFALYAAAAAASVAKAIQCFAGREAQFAQLSAHVSSEGGQRLAIYGLGGCGKTALALELAYRSREQEPTRAIFWVPALSQESFEQAYREIGSRLRIPEISDAKADVKQLVKALLSNESFGPWLMIVDNADDTSVLLDPLKEGDGRNRLIDYLPNSCRGSFVFTTRTRKAAVDTAGHNIIALGELTKLEATEMLRTRLLQEHQHELIVHKKVDEFLDMLTCLALAIVQAVAFINTNDISLSEYISHYRYSEENAFELLHGDFEDYGRYRDTKNPVATTWYISFEQIRIYDELAAEYLSFMACTANSDIPASMLPANRSIIAQTKAIGTLKAYAFITERQPQPNTRKGQRQTLAKTFDVHPLVHKAMQGWLKDHSKWNMWLERSLTRLVEIIPFGDYETRTVWTGYLPHATHMAYLKEAYLLEGSSSLLERIGYCEQLLGRYQNAEQAHRQVLEKRKKNLGEEHPDTLLSMKNVARALGRQGKYAEAEKMHQETLALLKKVIGEEHPDTLSSMGYVARTLGNQGEYAKAEKMHRETLALRTKVIGEEHPDTLTSMSYVAKALVNQGKYAKAEKMHRETLALRKKVLGEEHPDTLTSMYDLAFTLSNHYPIDEAITLLENCFVIWKQTFSILPLHIQQIPETVQAWRHETEEESVEGNEIESDQSDVGGIRL